MTEARKVAAAVVAAFALGGGDANAAPARVQPSPASPRPQAAAGPVRARPVWVQPRMPAAEATQLAAAAGFRMQGGRMVSICERPGAPKFAFTDLDGDGRFEAVVVDRDPGCYGEPGDNYWILRKDGAGRWQAVGGGPGRLVLLESRTRGWRDYTIEGQGCQTIIRWDGVRYGDLKECAGAAEAREADARAASGFPPGPPPPLSDPERAAAFRAAGYKPRGRDWVRCVEEGTGQHPTGQMQLVDIDGDGRSEAWITEDSSFCYGATGTAITVVTRGPDGRWRKVLDEVGVAGLVKGRRRGWPDIEVGGPGLGPVPVYRFNGVCYVRAGERPQ